MLNASVTFNPQWHRVVDTEFARWCREELRDPDLFTYRHARTGNWVLACWPSGSQRRDEFMELVILGAEPHGTRAQMDTVRRMRKGNPAGERVHRDNLEALRTQENVWGRKQIDEQNEEQDLWRFLRRNLKAKFYDHPEMKVLAGVTDE